MSWVQFAMSNFNKVSYFENKIALQLYKLDQIKYTERQQILSDKRMPSTGGKNSEKVTFFSN